MCIKLRYRYTKIQLCPDAISCILFIILCMNKEKEIEIMSGKKTIGDRIDKVVDKVSGKAGRAKEKIAAAGKDFAGIARDISKSAKKAAVDSGSAVSGLVHKGK